MCFRATTRGKAVTTSSNVTTRTGKLKTSAGIQTSLGVTMTPNQDASEVQLEPGGRIKGAEVDRESKSSFFRWHLLVPRRHCEKSRQSPDS